MNSDLKDPDEKPEIAARKPSVAQAPIDESAAIRLSIPVTIILERRMISRSFWSVPSWYLHTVAVGENVSLSTGLDGCNGVAAGSTDKGELFAWTGFDVILYKDACERYWHALIGDKPQVYVTCRDEAEDDPDHTSQLMQPISVTIDYDEASAAAETDVPVLSAPIPGELYKYMERFVLTHYKPQQFKKRKRRNWSGEQSENKVASASGQAKEGQQGGE